MVSQIEGTVTAINEAVINDPELARKDPYGEGWLVTVQVPDSKINFRNLMGGTLPRLLTEFSALKLHSRMSAAVALQLQGPKYMRSLAQRARLTGRAKNRRHRQVDPDQDEVPGDPARASAGTQRRSRDDQGALAVVEDPKVVHMRWFSFARRVPTCV